MSTLTSSPSPAASPHAAFLVQRSSRTSSSSSSSYLAAAPQRSPALSRFPATSPRRAPNASSAASTHSQQRKQSIVGSSSISTGSSAYVDAGTQYSPDGLPPTATRSVAAATGLPPGSIRSTNSRKRKEITARNSPEPMSGTTIPSSTGPNPATVPGNLQSSLSRPDASHAAPSRAEQQVQEARSTRGHSAMPKRSRPDPENLKVMPLKYETCNPKDLGILISNMLMELIRINDQIPLRDGRLTRFHSRAPPGISVADYLQRLVQHATLSPPIMLSMVYYIDRLCTLYPAFTINSLTVHRFLIAAATVAAKGLSDSFWTNPTYARIGGIPVSELATLELELLEKVQWKIVPKPEVLEEYYSSLVNRTDGYTLQAPVSLGSDTSSLSESEPGRRESEEQGEDESMADGPT